MTNNAKKLRFVDLFCGAGGFSLGMVKAGLIPVGGFDLCEQAVITYRNNIGPATLCDIEELKGRDLPDIDVLIGSPPCQKFSQANYYTKTNDSRLIEHFMRLVDEVKPKYWVWENVLGARSAMPGQVLDAQNFGVPQRRRRHFVSNFDLPTHNNSPRRSIRDTINCANRVGILDGFNSTIYSLDGVSPTIRRIPMKWYDGRKMTKPFRFTGFEHVSVRDHLALMGFPPDFEIFGGKTSAMLQIGNAVCPAVGEAIGRRIVLLDTKG